MGAENTVKIVLHGEDQTRGAFSSALGGLQKFGKTIIGLAATGGAALAALGGGMIKLAADAEPMIGLRQGFAAITSEMVGGSKKMLKALQEAAGGLVTDRDLMSSFNTAAALISRDFAETLPDSMTLVRRAALATGQDMGFMLDSLVKGVGRVSPMILDNLGIQIQLSAVTERASEMFGKQTEELSKTEQQMALNEIVLEKLNEAYGDVPDITPVFARIETAVENLKDEIGERLLPVLAPLAEDFLEMAEELLPAFWRVLDNNIIPAVKDVAAFIRGFVSALQGGMDPIEAAIDSFLTWTNAGENLSEELFNLIMRAGDLWDRAKELGATVGELASRLLEAAGEFISWKDILITAAIAVAAFVLPIIWSLLMGLASIAIPVAGAIAAVALLRKAWESDWGGIRTKIEEVLPVIRDKVQNAIQSIRDWWDEHGQEILNRAGEIWDNIKERVLTAAQSIRDWWDENGQPLVDLVGEIWGDIQEGILTAAQGVKDWWDENGPKIQEAAGEIWGDIQEKVLAAAGAIQSWWEENGPRIVATVEGVWSKIKEGAGVAADYIRDELPAKFGEFQVWWDETWPNIAETLATTWERIQAVVESVVAVVGPAIGDLIQGITSNLDEFQPVLEAFKSLWEELAPILGGILVLALGLLVGAINGVAKAIGPLMQLLAGLLTLVISVLDLMVTSIKNGFRAIIAIFRGDTDELKRIWIEHWTEASDTIRRIGGAIEDIVQGFVNTVVNFIAGLVAGVIGFFKNLYDRLVGGSIVPDIVEGIKGLISGMIADVEEWVSTFVGNIVDFFQDLYEDATKWISDFVDDAVDFFQGLRDDVDEIIGGAIDVFTNLKEYLSGELTRAIDTLVNGAIAGFKSALKGVKDAAQWLIDKLSVLKGWLKKVGEAIPAALIGHSPSPFEKWLRGIGEAMAALSDSSHELARALGALEGPWLRLSQTMYGMMAEPQEGEETWWMRAAGLLSRAQTLGGPAGVFGSLLRERMVDPLAEAVSGMEEQLGEIDIVTFLDRMGWTMEQFQAMSLETLTAIAVMGEPGLHEAIKYKKILEERNALQEEYTRLQQKALGLDKAMRDLEFLTAQLDMLKLVRDAGLDVGKVMGGIQLGIEASVPDLVDAMSAAINALVAQANAELEVHSPSAVMTRIGRKAGRGLAMGLAEMQAEITRAGANLAASAVMGAAQAGPTYNFNLKAQYAYQDERTLRDELRVMAMLYGG